jgi:hypothetical protein
MMNHKAIYKLYPSVVSVDDGTGAVDKDGNKVKIDLELVNAWVDPEQYKYQRQQEYPAIADQLDYIYHNGIDAWKTNMIDPVKAKYPKGAV